MTIEDVIKQETKETTRKLWNDSYTFTPQLLTKIQGDGLQLIAISNENNRPMYWLARIDSSIDIKECEDIEGESFEEYFMTEIEEEFGKENESEKGYEYQGYPCALFGTPYFGVIFNAKTNA